MNYSSPGQRAARLFAIADRGFRIGDFGLRIQLPRRARPDISQPQITPVCVRACLSRHRCRQARTGRQIAPCLRLPVPGPRQTGGRQADFPAQANAEWFSNTVRREARAFECTRVGPYCGMWNSSESKVQGGTCIRCQASNVVRLSLSHCEFHASDEHLHALTIVQAFPILQAASRSHIHPCQRRCQRWKNRFGSASP